MRVCPSISPRRARDRQPSRARSMRAATSCELPARKLRRSMSSSMPTYSPFSPTATRRLLCLVMRSSARRDEIVRRRRETTLYCATVATRASIGWRSRIAALARSVAGDDADPLAVAHEQRLGVVLAHRRGRRARSNRSASMNTAGWTKSSLTRASIIGLKRAPPRLRAPPHRACGKCRDRRTRRSAGCG